MTVTVTVVVSITVNKIETVTVTVSVTVYESVTVVCNCSFQIKKSYNSASRPHVILHEQEAMRPHAEMCMCK